MGSNLTDFIFRFYARAGWGQYEWACDSLLLGTAVVRDE